MDRKDVEVMTCCCKGNEDGNVKHKQRDEQEKKALMTRLSRIAWDQGDGGGRSLLRGYSHTGVSDPGGFEWV